MNKSIPLVSVCMITYNHEQYIADAIEGVLMQKCNFTFDLIIGEDCSTDNTASIIKEYTERNPDIIKSRFNFSNLGMIPNFVRTLKDCTGKYIALCEGDDFWTDKYKLQKQFDFLMGNPEYGLVYTDYYKFHQKIKKYERKSLLISDNIEGKSDYNQLIIESCIHTATVCLRKDILEQYFIDVEPEKKNWMLGDYQIWLYFAIHTKIKYIPVKTAVYRILDNSASFRKNSEKRMQAIKSIYEVRLYFINRYGCSEASKRKIEKQYKKDSVNQKINIGYELMDYKMISNALLEKLENKITITLLDKFKLFSCRNIVIWKASRIILWIKRYINRYSKVYVNIFISKQKVTY